MPCSTSSKINALDVECLTIGKGEEEKLEVLSVRKHKPLFSSGERLAYIDLTKGPEVQRTDQLDDQTTATGVIFNTPGQDSFLSLTVMYPGWSDGCVHYVCVARTQAGRLRLSRVYVRSTRPTSSTLAQALRDLSGQLDSLTAAAAATPSSSSSSSSSPSSSSSSSSSSSGAGESGSCRKRSDSAVASALVQTLYTESGVYNGSTYFLPSYSPSTYLVAEPACRGLGGILAQIDDEEEYEFVKNFTLPILSDKAIVLLGATDEAEEGVWVNRVGGGPAGVLDWVPGGAVPDNLRGDQDCLALVKNFRGTPGIRMNDMQCNFNPYRDMDWIHSFLCEVKVEESVLYTDC
ncbi:pinin [Aplysia californica]|uniref:Pinin n=1 Tax=Aplysia californica TaxID=6500 RepID=A0ABM1VZH7_APLCA|nr:pinin [Aplysia californica]